MKSKFGICIILALLLTALSVVAGPTIEISNDCENGCNLGEQVVFTVDVTNMPEEELVVSFTSTGLESGDYSVSVSSIDAVTKEENETSCTQSFELTIPAGIMAGTYEATMTVSYNETDYTKEYDLTVNEEVNAKLSYKSPSDGIVYMEEGENKVITFLVENTGSVVLDHYLVEAEYSEDFMDYFDEEITFEIESVSEINPGDEKELSIKINVPDYMEYGRYDGNLKIKLNQELTKTIEIAINVLDRDLICEYGEKGNLEIVRVRGISSKDRFHPGEIINLEVEVRNRHNRDDLDVIVEAFLYDATEGRIVQDASSDIKEIYYGDREYFDIELEVPTDRLDRRNTYYLYLKVYEDRYEDDHCTMHWMELRLEIENDALIIKDSKIVPEEIEQGKNFLVSFSVVNIGRYDQDNVYAVVKCRDMDFEETSAKFYLRRQESSENDHYLQFAISVPEDLAPGKYYPEILVYFSDGKIATSKLLIVEVIESDELSEEKDIDILIEANNLNLKDNVERFTVPVLFSNKGNMETSFSVEIEHITWATSLGVEAPRILYPNERYHGYLYFELNDGISGTHNIRVNVMDGSEILATKLIEVNVQESVTEDTSETKIDSGAETDWFKDKSRMFWIAADILLIILAIYFITLLFKK